MVSKETDAEWTSLVELPGCVDSRPSVVISETTLWSPSLGKARGVSANPRLQAATLLPTGPRGPRPTALLL